MLEAGPDRVCAYEKPELTLRCWHRPVQGETTGHELPERDEWLNPYHAPFDDISRADWAAEAVVGGTFACLENPKGDAWCVGDNRFGQLGTGAQSAQSGPNQPPIIPVWPAHFMGLGTWHGCAIAAPHGLDRESFASCWGRGDFGQLGVAAPDVCTVDGVPLACAKTPQHGPTLKSGGMGVLRAGDLFTCATDTDGIRCWGASRDGFFGKAGSCPRKLVRAWPTLGAPLPAPHARCSSTPFDIVGARGFQQDFAVGPRGMCFEDAGKVRCVGGIPTPRGDDIRWSAVSPGQDASACTLRKGTVACWGEAYSPPNASDSPVAIELEPAARPSEVAVVGSDDPAAWNGACRIRQGCTVSPSPVAACPSDVHARDASEFLASAPSFAGQTVEVRGLLGVGSMHATLVGCEGPGAERYCCNQSGGPVVLGGAPKTIALDGFFCAGDESESCCNAPAYGQSIVAKGQVVRAESIDSRASGWMLAHATLCSEGRRAASP